jgi:hypothetical protein
MSLGSRRCSGRSKNSCALETGPGRVADLGRRSRARVVAAGARAACRGAARRGGHGGAVAGADPVGRGVQARHRRVGARRGAADAHGTKSVTIDERTTSAYHFQISTIPGETPNPDVVYADIAAAKPAGLQFDYNLVSAGTRYWFTVREDFATWNDVLAGGTRTWQQLKDGA